MVVHTKGGGSLLLALRYRIDCGDEVGGPRRTPLAGWRCRRSLGTDAS